jgi:uncharacterized protein (DUF1697 family)
VRQIVLLRGINLGARNRVAMAQLRELLTNAGFDDVRTYLQSGNVVLSSDASPADLAQECEHRISSALGLEIAVVVRTRSELARVVRRDPLGDVADDLKRYQVTFCSSEPDPALVRRLAERASDTERFASLGRELYAWHPDGVGRSKLAAQLGGKALGVTATARNWTTVTSLLQMADG